MPKSRRTGLSGFRFAQEGILHCFRTQPHMRFHFITLVFVLLSGLLLNLDNRDMLVLIFAVTLVIVSEMINTAIEAVVDMITQSYNPAAKLAKDVAAGAVLLSAMNAVLAGVLIFFGHKNLGDLQQRMEQNLPENVTRFVVVGIVLFHDSGKLWENSMPADVRLNRLVGRHRSVGLSFVASKNFSVTRRSSSAGSMNHNEADCFGSCSAYWIRNMMIASLIQSEKRTKTRAEPPIIRPS